jgi:hypothetical protein
VLGDRGHGIPPHRIPLLGWFWAIFFVARHKAHSTFVCEIAGECGVHEVHRPLLARLGRQRPRLADDGTAMTLRFPPLQREPLLCVQPVDALVV